MRQQLALVTVIVSCSGLWLAETSTAKPAAQRHEWTPVLEAADTVGDADGVLPFAKKAALDTIWIADWTFDGSTACDESGWIKKDNLIKSDGIHHWFVDSSFDGSGNIAGHGAILAEHDLCWVFQDGYDNDWYTALRFEYEGDGATYLSFDYLVDSEGGFDFLQVETDSACASFDLVDYTGPYGPGSASPAYGFRRLEFSVSGFDTSVSTTHVDSLELTDHGPGTHCCYIAFQADGAWSPADGLQPTTIGAALVVDNVVVEGMSNLTEDFEASPPYAVDFENIQEREPYGEWARVYPHITDNDTCTENPTCAWLATDYTTPTVANDPSMAFAPGQFVILNWLDDLVHSPWVSLASTPGASGTVLSFRRFPGNSFSTSRIVQNWAVRSKLRIDNSDTPAPGDSIDCLSAWGHASRWNSLSTFRWVTSIFDMESYFDPIAEEIQLRFRISDWQWIAGGAAPPNPHIPGPGPFWDRVRIGRRILTGPVLDPGIDTRTQAQDAFATEPIMFSQPNWAPSMDRFGSAAFSRGSELTIGAQGPNLVLGDSISVNVQDVRGAGGITAVEWYGSLTSGPHMGKAPPPWSVGANGFFAVPTDSVRNTSGNVLENNWFVSLDDEYFRGGDVLLYFWLATDALGGVSSEPQGLSAMPATLAEAQLATNGLHEVSFLPKINWDAGYLGRVQDDSHGKLEPTQEELANSAQANCFLYYENVNSARRSGDLNRTSFMYTLDVLGYQGLYDVYDHQGLGNTNNHLGGRATVQQVTGYALIVYDAGNRGPGAPILPDGFDLDAEKVDQAAWFRNYLAQGTVAEAGIANLWILGSNALEEKASNPLYATDMGAVLVSGNQGSSINPDILGQAAMVFSNGNSADFAGDLFSANGGCPSIRNYDALDVSGTATITHRYKDSSSPTLGDGAVVMNANVPEKWNTILQSYAWSDIRDPQSGPTSPSPEEALLSEVLGAVLAPGCEGEPSTDVPPRQELESTRLRTALHQNVPNPFNPVTTIRFDLSRDGRVELAIYDVAGRLVRTLVDGPMTSGAQRVVWQGLDAGGKSVPSGVYLCSLRAGERVATRKLMVLR